MFVSVSSGMKKKTKTLSFPSTGGGTQHLNHINVKLIWQEGEGGGAGMQCQIQVIFVFLQTQAAWQLVILAARIYERRFSHHRALVP